VSICGLGRKARWLVSRPMTEVHGYHMVQQ